MRKPTSARLEDPANEIRLLTIIPGSEHDGISCTISVYDRKEAPVYRAISYVWGDPRQLSIVSVDGKAISVRKNCQYALWQARLHGYLVVWLDAICINQNDSEEKSLQVAMMGDIYGAAERVLACIGPHDEHSLAVFRLGYRLQPSLLKNRDIGSLKDSLLSLSTNEKEGVMKPFCHGMCQFSQRAYWQRLWIVQELYAGGVKGAEVLCGKSSTDFEVIRGFHRVSTALELLFFSEGYIFPDTGALEYLIDLLQLAPFQLCNTGVLRRLLHFRCADPRDTIYACLALATDFHVPPDYSRSALDLAKSVMATLYDFTTDLETVRVLARNLKLVMPRVNPSSAPRKWFSWVRNVHEIAMNENKTPDARVSGTKELVLGTANPGSTSTAPRLYRNKVYAEGTVTDLGGARVKDGDLLVCANAFSLIVRIGRGSDWQVVAFVLRPIRHDYGNMICSCSDKPWKSTRMWLQLDLTDEEAIFIGLLDSLSSDDIAAETCCFRFEETRLVFDSEDAPGEDEKNAYMLKHFSECDGW